MEPIETPPATPIEERTNESFGFLKGTVRLCTTTTKAGTPCRAPAVNGHDYCRNHLGLSPKFTTEEGIFGSKVAARKRTNRTNLLQILKERDPVRLINVLEDGLTATKWRFNTETGEREPTDEPDWDVRLTSVKELLDRTVGKAPKTVEHTGEGGGPITIAAFHAAARAITSNDPLAIEAYYQDAEFTDADDPPP